MAIKYRKLNPVQNKRTSRLLLMTGILCIMVACFISCENFYEPDIGNAVNTDDFYSDQREFRAAAMGLYALQQDLVEQLVILGELRGDLMKITDNADTDLREIYYFNPSPGNKYASARGFYRLIAACNKFLTILEDKHPEVLDPGSPANNFDRYYGEAMCMRAWAYFNAARIYGRIPYIHQSLQTISEIEEYVNSPKEVRDTLQIVFVPNGYDNDTTRIDTSYTIENTILDINSIIDTLTLQLNTKVKATGVNYWAINGDVTWDATTWTDYSKAALLGQMYLTRGDLVLARESFFPILYNNDAGFGPVRFGMDQTFRNNNWRNILTSINLNEHIFTIRFNKADRQQNKLQYLTSSLSPNSYQLKPSAKAVYHWETIWKGHRLTQQDPSNPNSMMLDTIFPGTPGDFYRGINVAYGYFRGEQQLTKTEVEEMLEFKRVESYIDVENIMSGVDTVITKYSLGKDPFAWDTDFLLYRAASIHLYAAEITANQYRQEGTFVKLNLRIAERFLNDGSYRNNNSQLGVRGRVGYAEVTPYGDIVGYEYVTVSRERIYTFDPYTNQVTGSFQLRSEPEQQIFIEDAVIEERARELAYEGERFYDLMRVAKRRNDPSFLADRVASKFDDASEASSIRAYLMNENNWYLPFELGTNAEEQ